MAHAKTFHHPIKGLITTSHLDENESLLILSSFPGFTITRLKRLIDFFGNANNTLQANLDDILKIIGKNDRLAAHWHKWPTEPAWKKNITLIAQHDITLLPYSHIDFPKSLLRLTDCPPLLYVQGKSQVLTHKCIAIVGTRRASTYGTEIANQLARDLAACGYIIISGLARGIDTAAHLGALETGQTVAIIGSGLADIYPKENLTLATRISHKGALLSELPMMAPPDRLNFPQRNRIVAGMAAAIVLIEAPLKSGAMITMHMGQAQGKKLFAIPGRLDWENFKGNHSLLKSRQVTLIESAQDILNELGCQKPSSDYQANVVAPKLEHEELNLLKQMPLHEIAIDELVLLTAMKAPLLNALLMGLLLKGAVKEFPGRLYKKVYF